MKEMLIGLIVIIAIVSLSYGGWLIKREFNYSFDYENKVVKTIHSETDGRFAKLEKQIKELQESKVDGWGND